MKPQPWARMDPEWVTFEAKLEWHLETPSPLIRTIISSKSPSVTASYEGEVVSGSRADGPPAPMRLDAVDDADELWSSLVAFASTVSEWLGGEERWDEGRRMMVRVHQVPAVAGAMRGGRVVGTLPTSTVVDVATDVDLVVAWVLAQADQLEARADLQREADPLFALIRKLSIKYGHRARAVRRRVCPECQQPTVVVAWAEQVLPRVVRGMAQCEECRRMWLEDPT